MFGKKELKVHVAAALEVLDSGVLDEDGLSVLLKPAFSACAQKDFTHPSLDAFWTTLVYPPCMVSCELVQQIVCEATHVYKVDGGDRTHVKICKIIAGTWACPTCFSVHGRLLRSVVSFLVQVLATSESETAREVAEMSVQECVRFCLGRYGIPAGVWNGSQLAEYVCQMAVARAEFCGSNMPAIAGDVDLTVLVRTLCESILSRSLQRETVRIVSRSILIVFDEVQCGFVGGDHFIGLLNSDLHAALLTLVLDTAAADAQLISEWVWMVWNRFASSYVVGLSEVLDRGIIAALASPSMDVVRRAMVVVARMVAEAQFLVDCFVNYDCAVAGFRTLFKLLFESVTRYAYPNQEVESLQWEALSTLERALRGLWVYFQEARDHESEEVSDFLEARKVKDVRLRGLELFKRGPKKGLEFFIANGFCAADAGSVAAFFRNSQDLDNAGIGEILGGRDERSAEILKAFCDTFDFRGVSFESAFRQFLGSFRVPGEAQMIDRVMQQFGVKFYGDNANLFSSADTVYALAFSALMLHTDAHHPSVKARMTLEQFITNNRGLDNGDDLPRVFLEDLYRGITSKKMELVAEPGSGFMTRAQKQEMYRQRCATTLTAAREGASHGGGGTFTQPKSPALVGPMFNSVWGAVLGCVTVTFDAVVEEDAAMIDVCRRIFVLGTEIAAHGYCEDALQTFVDSLLKFGWVRGKSRKSLVMTGALFEACVASRMFMKGLWVHVLRSLSQLDKMSMTDRTGESLFERSQELDRESILDFVQAMCTVSLEEIEEGRVYHLVKFAGVAYWNLARPLFVWREIWDLAGRHLASVACSRTETIAMTAVDVIRQLVQGLLPLVAGSPMNVQGQVLGPFLTVFERSPLATVRAQVLECVKKLAADLTASLSGGWDLVLQILRLASGEQALLVRAFDVLDAALRGQAVRGHLVHAMDVLGAFALNDPSGTVALRAIELFLVLAGSCDGDGWVCQFQNLQRIAKHGPGPARGEADVALRRVVMEHGSAFAEAEWAFLFGRTLVDLIPVGQVTGEEQVDATRRLEAFFAEVVDRNWAIVEPFATHVASFLSLELRAAALAIARAALGVAHGIALRFEGEARRLYIGGLSRAGSVVFDPLFVGTIDALFQGSGDEEALLGLLRSLGEHEDEMLRARARHSLFANLARLRRADEATSVFAQAIADFASVRSAERAGLVAGVLRQLASAEACIFEAATNEGGLALICDLVEYEEPSVRGEIPAVLRRRRSAAISAGGAIA